MYTIREAAKESGIDLKEATVAVQGFGNAGRYAACIAKSRKLSHLVGGTKQNL